jgi:serine/threonine protein kinase
MPMVKAKSVAGNALGLRCAHRLGLLHGGVKASNSLVDADRGIQIADFSLIRLETDTVELFSVRGSSSTADLSVFPLFFVKSPSVQQVSRPYLSVSSSLFHG